MTQTTTIHTTMPTNEPTIMLPMMPLLAASAGSALVVGGIWVGIAAFVEVGGPMLGISSGLLVALVMAGGIMLFAPWKPRPLSLLGTLWLGGTVMRLFITPLLAWVLYSAASFDGSMLALAVGTTYFVALMGEVLVLATAVRRSESSLSERCVS